jgi:peptidoglycan/xylan/chitin deacetylase (PgdA/CDA1 family)
MAATLQPRRPTQTSTTASNAPGRLRVRWDRVTILVALVVIFTTVIAYSVVDVITRDPKPAATKPSPSIEVAEQATSNDNNNTHHECPQPAAKIIHTAPGVTGESDATARTVALTFDDGPGPATQAVLDVLAQSGVRATFFVVGQRAAAEPEMLRRIVAGGHALGDHTWSHHTPSPRTGWKQRTLSREIERTKEAIFSATGLKPCLFRPPGGVIKGARTVTRSAGLSMILWSVDPRDWSAPPSNKFAPVIQKRVAAGLEQEHPVILLHDGGGNRLATVAALAGIINDYRSHGYRFVTLDELR